MIIPYPFYGSTSGGWEWLIRYSKLSSPACIACNMRAICPKCPTHPIVATAPLDLLHGDFTRIETTRKLNKWPRAANILVSQDHFTKHVIAYVIPYQTTKTVTKFQYQGYILIFRAPARLLSNWGANFMSSIIDKMYTLISVKELQTMLYHPQTNGWWRGHTKP